MRYIIELIIAAIVIGIVGWKITSYTLNSWMDEFIYAMLNHRVKSWYPKKKTRLINYGIIILFLLSWALYLFLIMGIFALILIAAIAYFRYGIII